MNLSPFADRKLTSGARRILESVSRRSQAVTSPVPYFSLLMQELLQDENEAAAIVAAAIGPDFDFPLPAAASSLPREESFAQWTMRLLRSADRLAIRSSVEAVTGTEHLLLATIELDDWTRNTLESAGLDPQAVTDQVIPQEPELSQEPVEEIRVNPAGNCATDEPTVHRILDAAANRCREGLRVVEDYVRFGLDDRTISKSLKSLRHEMTAALRDLGSERWVHCRDTVNDVGTRTTTLGESYRGTPLDVVRAGLKRTEEALRTLEEFGKILDRTVGARLERSRYTFYTIEKAIETTLNAREKLRNRRLYLLVSADDCRYGLETTIRETVSAGVDIVQLREKGCSDRRLLQIGHLIRQWTHASGALMIVNDRPDIAVACGADGVHLGQDDLSVSAARKMVGGRMLIGVSTHHIEQAREAIFAGADYLGVGPVFSSQTKSFNEFAGLDYVSQVAQETSIPWYAIGGIDQKNLPEVLAAGAQRVAVSSAICRAAHPRGVAQQLSEALKNRSVDNSRSTR